MEMIAENLWHLQFPLHLLGADLQRHVAVIRLASGTLVIHSSGPFTSDDVAEISALGRVGWVMDTMLRHETFAKRAHQVFPDAAYYGPEGFSEPAGFPTLPLSQPPAEWGDELLVRKIDGVPSMEEYAVFHRASRTLIVADLFFDPDPNASFWSRSVMSLVAGRKHGPGISRAMRMAMKDKAAFRRSLDEIRAWDFDRIIVGHGAIVAQDGQRQFDEARRAAGY